MRVDLNEKLAYILTTLNVEFFNRELPQLRCTELHEVGWPAFATEKGSSPSKHAVSCELTTLTMECSRQMRGLQGSVPL